MSSEPNLYGVKPSSSSSSSSSKIMNKSSFVPVKSTSAMAPSYKLSATIQNIMAKELRIGGNVGGGFNDDASLQSTNTRRRFQRRGSKSPSMFKQLSLGNLGETLLKEEQTKRRSSSSSMSLSSSLSLQQQQQPYPSLFTMDNNDMMSSSSGSSEMLLPHNSVRSCLTSLGESTTLDLGESTTTFSSDFEAEEESLEFGGCGGGSGGI